MTVPDPREATAAVRICVRCNQPADGYAQINDDWYCHPDDETKPDCYALAFMADPGIGVGLIKWIGWNL